MALDVQTSLDFGSSRRILNLPAPLSANEPVRQSDLTSALEGMAWKDNVRVYCGTNITLTSPGAALDGVTMAVNDRFIAGAQTTGSQNGIYVWNGAAVAATRSLDANTAAGLENATASVDEGTSAGTTKRQSLVNFTLGSGTPTFVNFGTSAPAATESVSGIVELATQGETDTGTDDVRAVTPLKLKNWSGGAKRYAATLGNGSATSITVTHNLASRDVTVEVYRNSGNYDTVLVETQRSSVNAVTLLFDVAPASNALMCVVKY